MGSGLEMVIGRALLVGARVSALMVFAPFLASATIAPRIKAGFTVALTALLYPVVAPSLPALSGALGWQVAGGEFVVGLIMGITLQFVFEGVELAGQVVGFQVGHSLANLINPLSDAETPILSNFYQAVALLIFLQLDVHHWVLRGLAKSFEYCPPGMVVASPILAQQVWRAAGGMLVMAVQVCHSRPVGHDCHRHRSRFSWTSFSPASRLVRGHLRQKRRSVFGGDGDLAVLAGAA